MWSAVKRGHRGETCCWIVIILVFINTEISNNHKLATFIPLPTFIPHFTNPSLFWRKMCPLPFFGEKAKLCSLSLL